LNVSICNFVSLNPNIDFVMKNIILTISNVELEELGLEKEKFSYSEFVKIVNKELWEQECGVLSEPIGEYMISDKLNSDRKVENRKKRIVTKIDQVKDDLTLRKIEIVLNKLFESIYSKGSVIKPLRANISVDEMVKEQNFSGIERDDFDKLIDELDIKEPLADLLKIA